MKKGFLALVVLILAATLTLYLLKVSEVEGFDFFNWHLGFGIILTGIGIIYFLRTIFNRKVLVLRKVHAYISVALIVAGTFCFLAYSDLLSMQIAYPLVGVVALSVIFLIIFTRPKARWDEGDNHKPGYKTYKERVAIEEKQREKEEKQREKEERRKK